jgi:adenylate cyclase
VAEELKVDNVLEGSVRKAGNKLRISAQLIKVSDDTHLWADTYDRELIDVFAIQDEISQAVVQSLKVKLLGKKTEPLVKDYTKSTQTYELFLKGIYFMNKGEYEKAIEYMEKTIQADPGYVPAYASLAGIYNILTIIRSLPPWEMKPKINTLLKKAIEIDESYGLPYLSLGRIKMIEYDWPAAEENYKRGIEFSPNHARAYGAFSWYLAAVGHISEAVMEAKRAVELDPLASFERFHLTYCLALDHQIDQAIQISKEMLELDSKDYWGTMGLTLVYVENEMYENAVLILEKYANVPVWTAYLGFCYGRLGNIEGAHKILEDCLHISKNSYFSPYLMAMIYSGLGDPDKVFEWLNRAYEIQDPNQTMIKMVKMFANFHSDPRWMDQMKKRGLAD